MRGNRVKGGSGGSWGPPVDHRLKTWPEHFQATKAGRKPFDLRREDDKVFVVGDLVELAEFDPAKQVETGETTRHRIVGILRDFPGLEEGYCILGWGPKV